MGEKSVQDLIQIAVNQCQQVSTTAELDAQILLCWVIKKPRSWLFAYPDARLNEEQVRQFESLVLRRQQGEPVAYLVGSKGFFDLQLEVCPDVLVPRPETECLVDYVLSHGNQASSAQILDLGTGSGAIALALAHACPSWSVVATDVSEAALVVAERNRQRVGCDNVTLVRSDWYAALSQTQRFDVIVSNPPYVAQQDPHLSRLAFEPLSALVSGSDGLDDIRLIIEKAPNFLVDNGLLLIEHGYDQAERIVMMAKKRGFKEVCSHTDLAGVDRFVVCFL